MNSQKIYVQVESLPPVDVTDRGVAVCFLGETVRYSFRENALDTISCSVAREPEGANASFTDEEITPDVIGYHRHTVSNGGGAGRRAVHLVVFPAAAATDPRIAEPNRKVLPERTIPDPSPRSDVVVRATLRAYVLDRLLGNADLAELDALTANAPLPASVDWRRYAGA